MAARPTPNMDMIMRCAEDLVRDKRKPEIFDKFFYHFSINHWLDYINPKGSEKITINHYDNRFQFQVSAHSNFWIDLQYGGRSDVELKENIYKITTNDLDDFKYMLIHIACVLSLFSTDKRGRTLVYSDRKKNSDYELIELFFNVFKLGSKTQSLELFTTNNKIYELLDLSNFENLVVEKSGIQLLNENISKFANLKYITLETYKPLIMSDVENLIDIGIINLSIKCKDYCQSNEMQTRSLAQILQELQERRVIDKVNIYREYEGTLFQFEVISSWTLDKGLKAI
jgi:hypothetical protein